MHYTDEEYLVNLERIERDKIVKIANELIVFMGGSVTKESATVYISSFYKEDEDLETTIDMVLNHIDENIIK